MVFVGIDLGTSNSVIATKVDGKIKALPIAQWNAASPTILPSLVDVKNGELEINRGDNKCETVIRSVKRLMGTSYKLYSHSPSEVSAAILEYMVKKSEEIIKKKIDQAVITVPAYFDDVQRLATKLAASIANIKILRLINEPTAAALAYGLEKQQNEKIAIYDLGGGTFDFSILNISNGVFQVLATGGDTNLGGDDIDQDIATFCCARYGVSFNELNSIDKEKCLYAAKELKEKVTNSIYLVLEKFTLEFHICENELEQIISKRLQKSVDISNKALDDAELKIEQLNYVILIGGMTKSKEVKKFIKRNFKCKILDTINPDETVAIGAAMYAETLISKNSLLIDVTPLTLGVETFGNSVDTIIARNSPVPFEATVQYTTAENNQTKMSINVLQGESQLASNCRSLAKFELKNIPPMPAGEARINVNFKIDVNGILQVKAWEDSSDIIKNVTIEPTEGLTEELLLQMISNCKN